MQSSERSLDMFTNQFPFSRNFTHTKELVKTVPVPFTTFLSLLQGTCYKCSRSYPASLESHTLTIISRWEETVMFGLTWREVCRVLCKTNSFTVLFFFYFFWSQGYHLSNEQSNSLHRSYFQEEQEQGYTHKLCTNQAFRSSL